MATLRAIHSYSDPAYGFSTDFFLNLFHTQYALYYVVGSAVAYLTGVAGATVVLMCAYLGGTVLALRSLLEAVGKDERICLFVLPLLVNVMFLYGLLPVRVRDSADDLRAGRGGPVPRAAVARARRPPRSARRRALLRARRPVRALRHRLRRALPVAAPAVVGRRHDSPSSRRCSRCWRGSRSRRRARSLRARSTRRSPTLRSSRRWRACPRGRSTSSGTRATSSTRSPSSRSSCSPSVFRRGTPTAPSPRRARSSSSRSCAWCSTSRPATCSATCGCSRSASRCPG